MNPQETASEPIPAPKKSSRLALWFIIYLAAQLPIIWRLGSDYNPISILLFPSYLGMLVAVPLNMMPDAVSHVLAYVLLPLGFAAGYVVYPLHLMATLRARTRRRFSFLMLVLATMLLMNQTIQWGMMNAITV